ncbi:MAG: hypothetical protein FK732_03765 [Asgard group archaeon]|nr:hypothetical protein [Asgard group archaeon]
MQKRLWLPVTSILNILTVYFAPYMIDIKSETGSNHIDIIFFNGRYYHNYWGGTDSSVQFFDASYWAALGINFDDALKIVPIVGICCVALAGLIYLLKRDLSDMIAYITAFAGGLTGFVGSILFIPFGLSVRSHSFFSTNYNWFFGGVIAVGGIFLAYSIWGLVRFIKPPKKLSAEDESRKRLGDLAEARRSLELIHESYDTIPIHMLQRLLKINSEEDLETLRQLLPKELQFSVVGTDVLFLKETLSKMVDPVTLVKATSKFPCFHCSSPITLDEKICPSCKKTVPHCSICKLPIKHDEIMGSCPKCETRCHLEHLKTWIEIRMKCPTCLRKLLPTEIQQVDIGTISSH